MNLIKYYLPVVLFFFGATVHAQSKTKQEKGFFNITNVAELQLQRSIDSTAIDNGKAFMKSGFEANTITGFFLNSHLSIGLGVGIQLVNYERSYNAGYGTGPKVNLGGPDIFLLPIFADFRFYPTNFQNNAMLILNVGYAPVLKSAESGNYLNGGPLVKLGAGYKIHLGYTVSLLPSLNLRAQRFGENTAVGIGAGIGLMF